MGRLTSLLVLIVSGAISWGAYYGIAIWFESQIPVFMATALFVSLLVHEIGHWLALEAYGIRAFMFFAVLLGGAVPQDTKKLKTLPWSKQVVITLAGPAGNVAVVLGAVVLQQLGYLTGDELSRITNINGALIAFNLVPISILDGGRFAKYLFDSIPERRDGHYVKYMAIAVYTVAIIVWAANGEHYFITAAMVLWGASHKSRNDDPSGSRNRLAMNEKQYNASLVCYVALMALGIAFSAFTPPWPA